MRFLITRPETGASETARHLASLGHEAHVDPMLRIVHTGTALPKEPVQALAFTSANGVAALARHVGRGTLPPLPTFAVGSHTAAAAKAAGFKDVTDCAGDMGQMAAALARLPAGTRVLHAAAAERAGDLQGAIAHYGIEVAVAVLYRSVPVHALAASTALALTEGRLDAALHYSPRTVTVLLRCIAGADVMEPFLALRHMCMSHAIATQLQDLGAAVEVASVPSEDALLRLL